MMDDFEKFRTAVTDGTVRLKTDSAKALQFVLFRPRFGGTGIRWSTRALFRTMALLTAAGYLAWIYLLLTGQLVLMVVAFAFSILFWKNLASLASGFVRDVAIREPAFLNASLESGMVELESASVEPAFMPVNVDSARGGSDPDDVAAYEKAVAAKPDDGKLLFDLAVTYLARGEMDLALEAYNRLSLLDDRLAGKLHDLIVRVGR